MYTFVMEKLVEWQLPSLIDKFKENRGDVALLVLPLLLPATVYRIGQKVFRSSIDEARKAFIDLHPISRDFDEVHGETGLKSWATFFAARILRIALKENKLNQSLENIQQENRGDVALLVLPLLLPATVYRIGQKVFRSSIDEARKAFIDLHPEVWGRDGVGCSQGQGVGGIPLALKSCCKTLEDLVVPPGVAALCKA
ncbi:hypothetical protein DPX16_2686 [Anabarilius grahami]|uniref:Uncharacterized protein n=1 Tax=Anabarilius grahami TaxID=495550 RepID=A0A3N0YPL9_ANAGA|nr:hypothetical protein DPX16_2686 [Anabarilius grahami]